MCIFCERAKAALDDPLAALDGGGGWDADGGAGYKNKGSSSSGSKRWEATLGQKREAERCEELRRKARLPVTVITGFLGAGKTTFVNHLLSARHGRKLAVIENEFGEVAIDDALLGDGGVERGEEAQQVILMPNGCMCCRVRGDLVDALKRLIVSANNNNNASTGNNGDVPQQQTRPSTSSSPDGGAETGTSGGVTDATDAQGVRGEETASKAAATAVVPATTSSLERSDQESTAGNQKQAQGAGVAAAAAAAATAATTAKLDGIVLECSGLDELAPVLQTFFADPFVQEHVRLDAVVCLCDSPRLLPTLALPPPPAPASASTTGDDTSAKGLKTAVGDDGQTGDASAAGGASSLVMSQLALSDRILLNKCDLITPAEGDALVDAVKERFPGASVTRCERGKVDVDLVLGIDSFSLDKALEMDQEFADILADSQNNDDAKKHHHHHHHHDGGDGEVEQNGVVTPSGHHDDQQQQPQQRRHRHGHDRLGARSVGVELAEAPIDWGKFTAWLKSFLEKEGEELIWRLKGVLWTAAATGHGNGAAMSWGWGAGRRTVVQGLYGHFESEVSEWPTGATRVSRMVFIGDLSPRVQEALRAGVRSCVATPRARPPPPKLRPQPSTAARRDAGGFASRLGSVKFGGGGGDADMLF